MSPLSPWQLCKSDRTTRTTYISVHNNIQTWISFTILINHKLWITKYTHQVHSSLVVQGIVNVACSLLVWERSSHGRDDHQGKLDGHLEGKSNRHACQSWAFTSSFLANYESFSKLSDLEDTADTKCNVHYISREFMVHRQNKRRVALHECSPFCWQRYEQS